MSAGGRSAPNVASIPPGLPFLPTLVEALINGDLIPAFTAGKDPVALSNVTVWVPTRRAARELQSVFVDRLGGKAALLPRIHALGDGADDVFLQTDDKVSTGLEPVVPPMRRRLILSQLVDAWAKTLNRDQRELYRGQDIVVPSSMSDAVSFAIQLGQLMDTVATEEANWSKLSGLAPDDYAAWWQLTLEFLKIASEQWPAILAEAGLSDAAGLRVAALRRQAAIYATSDGKGELSGPVIAAGSTGSIPATAELLKTIACLQDGVLVLPGLDRDMSEEAWSKVDLPDNDRHDSGAAPCHPQFGLKRLLDHLGLPRDEVRSLSAKGAVAGALRVREYLVSEALKPADFTAEWRESFSRVDAKQRGEAVNSVALCEASNERQEALAIALALRESLQDDARTAALVTPDRNLARRVAVELKRFGVNVDDSAGQPLRNRSHGTFARLVVEAAFNEMDTLTLAGLIKHPLARFGAAPARVRHAARMIELTIMRGSTSLIDPSQMRALVSRARDDAGNARKRTPQSVKRLSSADWEDAAWLADELARTFPGGLQTKAPLTFGDLSRLSIQFIEQCARDEAGNLANLYDGEAGRELRAVLGDVLAEGNELSCLPAEWPSVFDALLEGQVVRPLGSTHPRVMILGPIEARLHTFDRVVLGGLNEGNWPAATRNDPFLSRPMKLSLGLPAPERRTGLAAHDFQMLLGMGDVVLTRAKKADNAPSVASRWVQRLSMLAGDEASTSMKARGQFFLDWATQIDVTNNPVNACKQPSPAPPVDIRPEKLSVTEVETWIRDPYAIYARHVLKLEALEPLIRAPDARERGTLYHAIMERFVREMQSLGGEATLEMLLAIARDEFDKTELPGDLRALWWLRFGNIAEAFIAWHRDYLANVDQSYLECRGETDEGLDSFRLSGIADRIDRMKSGKLSIIDYKTGIQPTKAQVQSLLAPQLLLEAAMAKRGGFGKELQADTESVSYARLRPGGNFVIDEIADAQYDKKGNLREHSASELAERAWDELASLVTAYRDASKPYLSKARPLERERFESDYDHLARVREWSIASEGVEE